MVSFESMAANKKSSNKSNKKDFHWTDDEMELNVTYNYKVVKVSVWMVKRRFRSDSEQCYLMNHLQLLNRRNKTMV